ncbi:MAG: hypothetical protein IPK13_07390 [Deltaproteobacteria bacterium]|nr:hypothetical protein [Deltaproteobacteria bacterium]
MTWIRSSFTLRLLVIACWAWSCEGLRKSEGPAEAEPEVDARDDIELEKSALRDQGREANSRPILTDMGAVGSHAAGGAPASPAQAAMFAGKPMPKAQESRKRLVLDPDEAQEAPADGTQSAKVAPTRAWFPETLLFRPSVRTNDEGQAEVEFPVPDRLTTWRVLALAHAKSGAQGGATTQFVGTLPTYVEPVMPSFLHAGDEIELPVQVVNTTETSVAQRLEVEISGAARATENQLLRVPPRGSAIEYIRVQANQPGEINVDAHFGGQDRVSRTIRVQSTLPASFELRSGTLAGPRTFEVTIPNDVEPSSARTTITVFPGALAVVRAELRAAPDRPEAADEAYALQLAGEAKKLLENLGETPDAEALRTMRIRTSQRVIRRARAPQVELVPMLLTAASAHPDDPVLSRLAARLKTQLARSQGPDGFFGGASGWSLQRLLVHTADAVRALSNTMTSPSEQAELEVIRLRAGGAFERNAAQIRDGYTAAAVLSSGARLGGLETKLHETLAASIKDVEGGKKQLHVEDGVERGDGRQPSAVEASALAILALEGKTASASTGSADGAGAAGGAGAIADITADLADMVLGAYRAGAGFGDGRANMLGLRALLLAFRTPIPDRIEISAFLDDQPLASTTLRGDRRKDVAILSAATPTAGGEHRWRLEASPPVPGLGFTMSIETHRLGTAPASEASARDKAVSLLVSAAGPLKVAESQMITVRAVAPARSALTIECFLPSGLVPSTRSLEQLVTAGVLNRFELRETGPILFASTGSSPEFEASFLVTPKFSGRLNTGTSRLLIAGTPVAVSAPAPWAIQPGARAQP